MSYISLMNEAGLNFINDQIRLSKKFVSMVAPLTFLGAIVIYYANLQNFYDTTTYTFYFFFIVILLFTLNFLVPYKRKKNLITRVIQNIEIGEDKITLHCFSFLNESEKHILSRCDVEVIQGYDKKKEIDIYNIKTTYSIVASPSQTFYLISSFFDDWEKLYFELTFIK